MKLQLYKLSFAFPSFFFVYDKNLTLPMSWTLMARRYTLILSVSSNSVRTLFSQILFLDLTGAAELVLCDSGCSTISFILVGSRLCISVSILCFVHIRP